MYSNQYSPADVFSVFRDIFNDTEEHAIGELWSIARSLPDQALPEILDRLCDLRRRDGGKRRNEIEVESAFSQMLSRVLKTGIPQETERIWRWLEALPRFHGRGHARDNQDDIRSWLSQHQPIVLNMFEIAYEELPTEDTVWQFLHDFRETTMDSLPDEDLARHALEILKSKGDTLIAKDCLLYRICGELALASVSTSNSLFEEFYEFADGHAELTGIREECCRHKIEDWRRENDLGRLEDERDREEQRKADRANLERTKASVKSGQHLHNLGILASVYFGLLSDTDRELAPVERLCTEIGDELLVDAIAGFSAVIRRSDLPSPIDVALLSSRERYCPWWYAILAGMDEVWQTEGALDAFPDTLLKSALAIAIELPTDERDGNMTRRTARQWEDRLFGERPHLVKSVCEDMARVELKAKRDYISILSLIGSERTRPWGPYLALSLLSEFPSASPEHLRYMVFAAISDPACQNELIQLTRETVSASGRVKGEQRAIWLSIGFMLDWKTFRTPLLHYAKSREWLVWILIGVIERVRVHDSSRPIESADQLEVVIRLVGERFENVPHPNHSSGSRNPWDAAEFVRRAINALSSKAGLDASRALRRLLGNDVLISYHDDLRHAIASQATVRREAEYKQPSWSKTTEALRGGKPANMADLHALILDHLEGLKAEIRQSNTDTYKVF